AYDLTNGHRHWSQSLATAVDVNRTQLLAHADYIPVLSADSLAESRAAVDRRTLAIQLIDKRSGDIVERVPIGDSFRRGDARCGVYMLATPTRMIVQAAGSLAAFGNSSLSRSP
ncbi:unnamed protein product, partial [marine sediment metagenome]